LQRVAISLEGDMKVLNVYWDSIPKEHHNHILGVLPKGGYIASLPFAVSENQRVIKVPVLGNLKAQAMFDPSLPEVCDIKVLEFYRVFARKDNGEPSYIWRKE
jgi:hypothetical protein